MIKKNAPVLGVCYYPEHWPEKTWHADAQAMISAGISWVRIGEFAWSRIEPYPNKYHWQWLDSAIETLGQAGLKIVLGTPSATPPAWMLEEFCDLLPVDENGQPRHFGSRRHYCFSHDGYRKKAATMAGLLAKRYAKSQYIAAWQIDNEYGCHQTTYSYSLKAKHFFQAWLKDKYGDIDALNKAWGNVFWSMEYRDFNMIGLPNLTVTEANPTHRLDFVRFSSDQVVKFNQAQVVAIKKHSTKPIIHNFMGRFLEFDHFALAQDLDIASWDSYPLGFLESFTDMPQELKLQYFQQGDPDFQAFHHDLYRSVGRGRFWIMEQQPGPVNWAPYNPAPLKGMVRLWSLEAFAHGAEVVSYFRFRQAPFGQEQMHSGLFNPDNSPADGYFEAQKLATDDLPSLTKAIAQNPEVAIVFDYQSAWAWKIQPQGRDFDYFQLLFTFYRALRGLGLNVDFIAADDKDFKKLKQYKLVVIPGLFCWNQKLLQALTSYSGIILFGPRTGTKTTDFSISSSLSADFAKFFPATNKVQSLPPGAKIDIKGGGEFIKWFEHLHSGGQVLYETSAGEAGLVADKNLYRLCGWPDDKLARRVIKSLAQKTGLLTIELPLGLRRHNTLHYRFWFNYSAEKIEFNGLSLAPAAVMIEEI